LLQTLNADTDNYPPYLVLTYLSLHRYRHHQDLHSFPTRRSSDLKSPRHGPSASLGMTNQKQRHCPSASLGMTNQKQRHCHPERRDRKSTRLNSSHRTISYAVFCLKKKKKTQILMTRNKVELSMVA